MAQSVEGDKVNYDTVQSEPTEIDALIATMDEDIVWENLKDLVEAGANFKAIFKKLDSDIILDNALTLMSYGATQEDIMAGLDSLAALHHTDQLIAAGISLNGDNILKAIQDFQEKSKGYAPYAAVTTNLDFVLELGVSADEILAVIKKDPRNSSNVLVQTVKRLKDAGAIISADEIDDAISDVWASSQNGRLIFENLGDLIAAGATIDVKDLVAQTMKEWNGAENTGAGIILSNYEQVIAAGQELDLNELVKKAPWYSVGHKLDLLLNREDVEPIAILDKLTAERVTENAGRLITLFKKEGQDINVLLRRFQGSQVTRHIESFMGAGADRNLILQKMHGYWILQDLPLLIDLGFTTEEILKHLSDREKIENYAKLKKAGLEANLDNAITEILDIDENYLVDFPDAYDNAAKFLLRYFQTLHAAGADILKIRDNEHIRDYVKAHMTREQKSLFTVEQLKALKKT